MIETVSNNSAKVVTTDGMLNINLQKFGEVQAILLFSCQILEEVQYSITAPQCFQNMKSKENIILTIRINFT